MTARQLTVTTIWTPKTPKGRLGFPDRLKYISEKTRATGTTQTTIWKPGFICNRAGFCSIRIRENIEASLVEPWFVVWRDRRSIHYPHGETKQALIFSQIEPNPARLPVYHP